VPFNESMLTFAHHYNHYAGVNLLGLEKTLMGSALYGH